MMFDSQRGSWSLPANDHATLGIALKRHSVTIVLESLNDFAHIVMEVIVNGYTELSNSGGIGDGPIDCILTHEFLTLLFRIIQSDVAGSGLVDHWLTP